MVATVVVIVVAVVASVVYVAAWAFPADVD
jgi:hypothetical protein